MACSLRPSITDDPDNQSETAPHQTPSTGRGRLACLLFGSFTARVSISAALLIAISAALSMLSLDYFLGRDLELIHATQVREQVNRVDAYVKRQVTELSAFARNSIRNRDFRNNLLAYLKGETSKRWLQSFVTTSTSLFKLNSMTLWTGDGGLLVATENIIGNMALQLGNYPIDTPRYPQAGLLDLGGQLWAVSTAPIIEDQAIVAVIQFSRLLNDRIMQDHFLDIGISVSTPQGLNANTTKAGTLDITTVDGRPLVISIARYDSTALSGLTSKAYVTGVIAVSSTGLVLIILLLIRRETRPFRVLQKSFAAVGHGDFDQRVPIQGCSEAVSLCNSFNRMLFDLSRLRDAEAAVQQEIRLAAIGRLAARVAHDINNPLTVIRAISDLSRRQMRDKDAQVASDMNRIYEQSNRCLQIAENLVAFSRPRNITLEPLDLYEQCTQYLQERERQHPRFQYELIQSDAAFTIDGNHHYLWQILDNLTDNAVEANDGRVVKYRCYTDGDQGVVEITDYGLGFADGSDQDIFEMFYTTKPYGTGLGLPNAIAIARAFGGTIRITDHALGQISVFFNLSETETTKSANTVSPLSPYTIATDTLPDLRNDI